MATKSLSKAVGLIATALAMKSVRPGMNEFDVQEALEHSYRTNGSRGPAFHTIAGAGLDVFIQEPLAREDHPLSRLFQMPNVLLSPHLTFYTTEAMHRLEVETLERCFEILEGRDVLVKSGDPRLR